MQNNKQAIAKTSVCNLDKNVAGMLCYIPVAFIGVVFSIIWLCTEKNDRELRFHAMQSLGLTIACIALTVALTISSVVMASIGMPFLSFVPSAASLLFLVAAIVGAVNAYQGKEYRLPVLAALVDKQL